MTALAKTRLLVIDHMALVRTAVGQLFSGSSRVEVVGTAPNVHLAGRKIMAARPDVILLDLRPPVERDAARLGGLMTDLPIPIILLTALGTADRRAAIETLGIKPSHVVAKPEAGLGDWLRGMAGEIEPLIRKAHRDDMLRWQKKRRAAVAESPGIAAARDRVIAIGASIGGTEALAEVLSRLPPGTPGVVVVQHMPGGFTRMLAARLEELCEMDVKEAEDGDDVRPGRVLIAPGGRQMRLVRAGNGYKVRIEHGPRVSGHRPSVNVLMHSVAEQAGPAAIGVILTGMGSDGADGMRALREAGARTFAQDEGSCVVFGMPQEAYRRGGAERLVPLKDMAKHLVASLSG